jgi:Ca2+-binding RTX toxin-like protein
MDAGEILNFDGNASTGALTINAGSGADALDGGTVNDIIYGNDGADTIDGQENSATAGADAIYGGAGNDTINASSAESEFSNSSSTALVTDTVDGGAGTDTLAFGAVATLTKAELANISNIEKLTLQDTSSIALSDAFLQANPGVAITLAGGTITSGAGTAADPSVTENITYTAGNGSISITTGTGDDTFNTASGALITLADTITAGTGTDTLAVYNDAGFGTTPATGDDVTVNLDLYHTGIENITVVDVATDDDHDVTINIAAAFTGTALTIDASSLDQNALSTDNEGLKVDQNSADLAKLTVTGGAGIDTITSGAATDYIDGGAGADIISSGAANDTIYGGAGNDVITPGAGRDYAEGGAGNDTFTVAVNANFEVSGGTETLDGGAGVDTLNFTASGARDISAAEMGSVKNVEVITVAGTTGEFNTTIGLGDAFFANNNGAVTVNTNSNGHTDSQTKVDGSSVSSGNITMIAIGNTTGQDDTLIGGAGDDTFQVGYKGLATSTLAEFEVTDVFTGNGGNDRILLDTQADGTNGSEGAITIAVDFDLVTGVEKIEVADANGSGAAADAIIVNLAANVTTVNVPAAFEYDGSVKTDVLDPQTFNVTNTTTADNSALTTKFTLTGGYGADSLYGAAGTDVITGSVGNDSLSGFGQSDTIDGGSGADIILGGDETALTGGGDSLSGGSGIDTISGQGGNDTILGGDGADIITGGTGADILTGGSGADVFKIATFAESAGSNVDTITDFTTGSDTINIAIAAGQHNNTGFVHTDLGDVETFAEVEALLSGVSGETVYVKDTGQIVVDANGDSNINASDFRINTNGTTGYDDADITFTILADVDSAGLTYTGGDGADSIIKSGDITHTFNGRGGNDTLTGGGAVDNLSGGAGNDIITDGDGIDIITGGAGNDTIIISVAGDLDQIVFSGITTAAPYAGANNGSDTMTGLVASQQEFVLWGLESTTGIGGANGNFTVDIANVINATGGTPVELSANVRSIDTGVADTAITNTLIASYVKTTTNTANNYVKMADNGAGILFFGDEGAANDAVKIYWIDSTLDGDGKDVTAADVHLLMTTNDINLGTLVDAQADG